MAKNMTYMRIYQDKAVALERMTNEDLGLLVKGMISYTFSGTEPKFDKGSVADCFWPIFKNGLDSDRASYESKVAAGSAGGKQNVSRSEAEVKQTASTTEADGKQNEAKDDSASDLPPLKKQDSRNKKQDTRLRTQDSGFTLHDNTSSSPNPSSEEEEEDDDLPDPRDPGVYATSNLVYLSPQQMEELGTFIDDLGADVVRHAVDEACAAGKRTWGFAKAVLNRYAENGIKTLGAAKASDEAFRAKRAAGDGRAGTNPALNYTTHADDSKEMVILGLDDDW